MATRLGDRLIAKGAITQKQLDQALNAQLIVGGHLGTCLIELGMIDESALGVALSEAFGVPHAPAEALQDIAESTIALVSAKVAEEYKVIPFRMTDKVLHMAMVDPANLPMLDALSFATDRRIVPWVAPELRIYQALEHYYGVLRRLRYIGICNALDGFAAERAAAQRKSAGGGDGKNTDGSGTASSPSSASVSSAAAPTIGGNDSDFADFQYGKNWHDIAVELRLDEPSKAPSEKRSAPSRQAPREETRSETPARDLVEVAEQLCHADRNSDIAEVVLDFAASRLERCLLFSVQKNTSSVWRARGFSRSPRKEARIPLTSGAFGLLLGNEIFRGVVPREETYQTFYKQLGIEQPLEALIIPIYLSDRLVAVFHGDNGPSRIIQGATDDYLRLFRLFSLTLNLLVMKNRIRDAAYPPAEIRKAEAHEAAAAD